MRKSAKKLVSVFLALMLVAAVAAPAMNAYAESVNVIPTVLIGGRNRSMEIYTPEGERVFPIGDTLDKKEIAAAVMNCIPYLGAGMLTGDYQPWVDQFYKAIAPYYEKILCDGNGDIAPTSLETKYDYSNPQPTSVNECDYAFSYDWRIDPCQAADYLETYITNILAATGSSKVNLVGRCYGGTVLSAYLYEYGCEKVHTAVYYTSISQGTGLRASELFAGKFMLDPQCIEDMFLDPDIQTYYEKFIDDPVLRELILSTLNLLNTLDALNIPFDKLTEFVNKVYPELAPKIVPATYGTFASIWSMVADEDYEQAKTLVFKGQEDKYAGLIEKIDHYHYDIQANEETMLKKLHDQGMRVAFVVKYGVPHCVPFTVSSRVNGDNAVEVFRASLGATAADYGKVLTDEQIAAASDPKYVSSDHVIDASTCVFPEYTWFIKGCDHSTFAASIDKLNVAICNSEDEMSVDSDPNYPQFMKYDQQTGAITPLTDGPSVREKDSSLSAILRKLSNFVKLLFTFIKNLFDKIAG